MLSMAEIGWSSTKAPETRVRRRLGARPLVGARSHESGQCHGSSTTRPGGCGPSSSMRGRARPSRALARPAVWRRPASSPPGRVLVLVGFSLAAESRPRGGRRRWKRLRKASGGVHRSLSLEYPRQSNPAHCTDRRRWWSRSIEVKPGGCGSLSTQKPKARVESP